MQKWLHFVLIGILSVFTLILTARPSSNQDYDQDKVSAITVLKQYFKSKGFRSGVVTIPELQIVIQLENFQFFKKEEEVENIYDRLKEIRNEFGLDAPDAKKVRSAGFCGVLRAEFSDKDAQAYFILIKQNLNTESRVYTLGHEYGHFLWYLEKQKLIYSQFNESKMIRSIINGNEEFAILCGWIANKIHGKSLSDSAIKYAPDRRTRLLSLDIKKLVDQYHRKIYPH